MLLTGIPHLPVAGQLGIDDFRAVRDVSSDAPFHRASGVDGRVINMRRVRRKRRNRCLERLLKCRNVLSLNQGGQIMSTRAVSQVILWCLMMVGIFSPAHALTQEELVAKVQAAGYSQVRDIKSTPEGTAVKATKDGKDVSLVVDSSGQIKERK